MDEPSRLVDLHPIVPQTNEPYEIAGLNSAKRIAFDQAGNITLPLKLKRDPKSPALFATIRLPWPKEIRSLRKRPLAKKEKIRIKSVNVDFTLEKGNQAARVQVLCFDAKPRAVSNKVPSPEPVIHFFVEPLNLKFAAAPAPEHDFEAIAKLFKGCTITLEKGSANTENDVETAEDLAGFLTQEHTFSLYEVRGGGTSLVNCDSAVPGC